MFNPQQMTPVSTTTHPTLSLIPTLFAGGRDSLSGVRSVVVAPASLRRNGPVPQHHTPPFLSSAHV